MRLARRQYRCYHGLMKRQGTEQVGDSFRERVYAAVGAVPRGRVASYGAIAAAIGQPRAARAVGHALRALDQHVEVGAGQDVGPDAEPVPWWRVVNAAGGIAVRGAFHDAAVQRALLEGEGVTFSAAGRIDWERCGWSGAGRAEGAEGAEGAERAEGAEGAEGAVHAENAENAERRTNAEANG
jgi:methylated-DNA-protein-cysteine methyltransferase related protein